MPSEEEEERGIRGGKRGGWNALCVLIDFYLLRLHSLSTLHPSRALLARGEGSRCDVSCVWGVEGGLGGNSWTLIGETRFLVKRGKKRAR